MRKIVLFLILAIILMSNQALAEKWKYVDRVSGPDDYLVIVYGSPFNYYIDADSVIMSGNKITFRTKYVMDKQSEFNDFKEEISKVEVNLSSKTSRTLEFKKIDASGVVVKQVKQAGESSKITKGTYIDQELKVALKYAKKGKQ